MKKLRPGALTRLEKTLRERQPELMDFKGKYAVLVPLVQRRDGLYLLYEVRALSLRRQPGEVCFPGGHMEPGENAVDCALRETEEELGIPAALIQILGELDFLIHRSNFIMFPVLALVQEQALDVMAINPAEVDRTFLVPVEHLRANPPLEYTYTLQPNTPEDFPYELVGIPRNYRWQRGGENVPVYPYEAHAIWGLTGRITRHLIARLEEGELA